MLTISDRVYKLISLAIVTVLIGALAGLGLLHSEGMLAAVITLIYAVVDVFKGDTGSKRVTGPEGS